MAPLLLILAAVLISNDAAKVTMKRNRYRTMGLKGKAFDNSIVFESRARSTLECAVLCQQQESCDTYTIDGSVCRGHSMQEMSTSSPGDAPGAKSYSKNFAVLHPTLKLKDCVEAQPYMSKSGVFTVYPEGENIGIQVYCDHDTAPGGWLVFQRRQDGSVDFYRDWDQYQQGFGSLNGEFWLGLDALHKLTSTQQQKLRVDLMKWDGAKGYAIYNDFSISDSSDKYRLNYGRFAGGNAGDSLDKHRGMQFSTRDRDHDTRSDQSCAQTYHGAWWYYECYSSDLNGRYLTNSSGQQPIGMQWDPFVNAVPPALHFVEMKFRAV